MNRAAMKKKIGEYFKSCDEDKRPYTLAGLAEAVGMSRSELLEPVLEPELKKAVAKCETFAEERLFSKDTSRGAEFILKNDHGWSDRAPESDKQAGRTIEIILQGELSDFAQ